MFRLTMAKRPLYINLEDPLQRHTDADHGRTDLCVFQEVILRRQRL